MMKLLLISLIMQFYGVNGLKTGSVISNLNVLDTIYNPALFSSSSKWKIHVLTEFSYANDYERQTKFVYDQFNNSVGEFTIYSNSHGYMKPTNLTASLSRRRINIVVGYELLASYEYDYDQYLRSNDYSRISHEYLKSQGGVHSYFAGLGVRGKRLALGLKFQTLSSSVSVTTNLDSLQPQENDIKKHTYTFFANVNLVPRIHLSFSYFPGITFRSYPNDTSDLPRVGINLPESKELGVSYTPPGDLVSEIQFIGGLRGDFPFYKINFRHNFLGIYPFEIGGSLTKIDNGVWNTDFSLGTGVVKNNFRMSANIVYSYIETTGRIQRNYYTETLLNLKLEYSK